MSQGGIETHLAYAEACLVNGQLSTAASHIQKLVQVGCYGLHVYEKSSEHQFLYSGHLLLADFGVHCLGVHDAILGRVWSVCVCGLQGTEAAPLVQDWVKATQTRAVAEQTSALLQAHAATLAASLSQS